MLATKSGLCTVQLGKTQKNDVKEKLKIVEIKCASFKNWQISNNHGL